MENFNEKPWYEKNIGWLIAAVIVVLLIVLWNFPTQAQTITKNYAPGLRVRIDGATPGTLKPCDVFFPGGGFVSQNWAICNTWSAMSVDSGHVSCKVGYSTAFLFPTKDAAIRGIKDGILALQYLKKNWRLYGIDTNHITLYGTSAGGFVALGPYMYPGNNVYCIVNGWGGILDPSYLANATIPVFNISTDVDKTVPIGCGTSFGVACCGSKFIGEELTARGVRNSWLVFEGYKHGLGPKDAQYNDRVAQCYIQAQKFIRTK